MAETRRAPTALELAATTDFEQVQATYEDELTRLIEQWQREVTPAQQDELTAQIAAIITAGGLAALATLSVGSAVGAALLLTFMVAMAAKAVDEMVAEAGRQGVKAPKVEVDPQILEAKAVAVAGSLASGLAAFAGKTAIAQAAPGVSGEQVAAAVGEQIDALSDAALKEQLGGALTEAQNMGRMAVLEEAPKPEILVASELNDRSVCSPCKKIDGTRFDTLADAQRAYPSGWYRLCQGQQRCRGMVIAVWDEKAIAASADTTGGTIPTTRRDRLGWGIRVLSAGAKRMDNQTATDTAPPEEGAAVDTSELTAAADTLAPVEAAPDEVDPGRGPAAWQGVLTVEGQDTGDGRHFAQGAVSWPQDLEDVAVPLRWNKEDSHGGEPRTVAVNVGRINQIWRDGNRIMGSGVFDLGHDDGREAHRRVSEGFLKGVSIDPDSIGDADVEYVWPEGASSSSDDDALAQLFGRPEKVIFHAGRIRGATLCDIPAFTEAYISLIGEGTEQLIPEPGADKSLVAHAAIDAEHRPPAEWFADPRFTVPVPITITDEGRVYGHAAQFGQCHVGHTDLCVTPPHEDYHPYFLTGEVVTADGSRVPVGQITVGTGHAGLNLGASAAAEHYDHTGAAVADVTVGNDAHGIWVAGAIRPGIDPHRVRELRASGQVSGDWRRIGGSLRLVGLLGVNVPGFPVPKMRARVASGAPLALVAAGRPTVGHGPSEEELQRQALRIEAEKLAERFAKSSVAVVSNK